MLSRDGLLVALGGRSEVLHGSSYSSSINILKRADGFSPHVKDHLRRVMISITYFYHSSGMNLSKKYLVNLGPLVYSYGEIAISQSLVRKLFVHCYPWRLLLFQVSVFSYGCIFFFFSFQGSLKEFQNWPVIGVGRWF